MWQPLINLSLPRVKCLLVPTVLHRLPSHLPGWMYNVPCGVPWCGHVSIQSYVVMPCITLAVVTCVTFDPVDLTFCPGLT
jgi:hypothetical protein